MALKSAKEIWDYLKGEYTGDERIRGMKVLNLIREFELQKMKESETVKEYSDRLLGIVNKAQEQRRLMRQDGMVEGALAANHKTQSKGNNVKKITRLVSTVAKKVIHHSNIGRGQMQSAKFATNLVMKL
ncbi:PREDICTED: uncharacterized protein LOC109206621 [Nicotiana attenuata]|uniref:uncharacterized protein LOC109206621 n=1 Tax=Nicotiana attenuata TaxID=49451 RepID=UPI000904E53A|nr:PREDICTED: uncharacterized protein LOC109206621 [Nicotiana attenuata]